MIIRHIGLVIAVIAVVLSSGILLTIGHVKHAVIFIPSYPPILIALIANVCIVTIFIVLCISACYVTCSFGLMIQI